MDNLIVDGFGIVYRSHYAFNNLLTGTGLCSGSVYGFLISMRTIKNKYPHCHLTIAWDRDATRRKEAFGAYKSNRTSINLFEQILDLKKIFSHLNVSQAEFEGEEADDVIASLTRKYVESQVYIYSSDKDMFQLVKDGSVIAIRPKRGKTPERFYDEEKVKEEFSVCPQNFACFQCLRGDSVDCIPGVPRIKSSLLAYLAEKYKDPTTIYEHLDEEKLTSYQRKALTEFQEQAMVNMQLVKLRTDLSLDVITGTPNADALVPFLDKYEIRSIDPNAYARVFADVPSFNARKAPGFESYSLFDEE
jgi:DNA polymerase-1